MLTNPIVNSAAGVGAYKAYSLSVPAIDLIDFTYDVATIVLWTT